MNRLLPLTALFLLLTACGAQATAYTLTFDTDNDTDNAGRQAELASAAARVIERRLTGLKQEVKPGDVTVSGDVIRVKPGTKEIADELHAQLTAPFSISLMVESEDASADITSEKYGAFDSTTMIQSDFDWVKAGPSLEQGRGKAVIDFTPKGKEKLQQLFADNRGKTLGVFVRGTLMAKKLIDPTDTQGGITLEGIPSIELASVFADDVNVGLHVTFTQAK